MSTKIKGHRIDDKAIDNKHLSDSFELHEGAKVILNHPTHDNATDLTLTQYQILTQGGNADAYHHHTGGGGGAEGIYTHPQIDAALLKIMMELNSIKYGIDHSIVDLFDDDSGVDYGTVPAVIDEIDEMVSDTPTLIDPETTYYYMVSAKIGQGWTGLSSIKNIKTVANTTGEYKKNVLRIRISPGTTDLKIFRSKSSMNFMYSSERKVGTLYSPEGLEFEVISREQTTLSEMALRLDIKGTELSTTKDLAHINYGAKWVGNNKNTVYQGVDILPVYGFINSDPTNRPTQLVIQWSSNPAYIPLDYIVQYSKEENPDIKNDTHWHNINDLTLLDDFTPANSLTDGVITSGSVAGNTRGLNKFSFKAIYGCTGMRIIVTRQVSGCQLVDINVYHMNESAGQKVYQDLAETMDIRAFKTLAVEINPGTLPPETVSLGLIAQTDNGAVNSIVTPWSNQPNNTTINGNPNRTLREIAYVGASDYRGYNKIRIRMRYHSGTVRISNATIALSNTNNNQRIDFPHSLRRVTFNNGQLFYEGTDAYIYSDWIHLDFPSYTFAVFAFSFVLESGALYYHSYGNRYMWYRDSYVGPASFDTDGTGWTGLNASYGTVDNIQLGKGYATVTPQRLPANNLDKPFKHYLDVRGITASMTSLKRLVYSVADPNFSDKYDIGDFKFCNIVEVLKEPGILASVTATSQSATAGFEPSKTYDGDNLTSYWESRYVPTIIKPESIMYKFSSEQLIDKIRILQNTNASYALENYKIQYTLDETADVNDAHDDIKWSDAPGLRFSHFMDTEFTGTINGGNVINCNFANRYLDHDCTPFVAKSIRIVVFKTKSNALLRIQDVQIYTADEVVSYELIHDGSTPATDTEFTFDDIGAAGTTILKEQLPYENTSGSYNIYHDRQQGLVRVLDKSRPGVLVTSDIDAELMMHFMLSTQEILPDPITDKILYYMSNNGGLTWQAVAHLDNVQTLTSPGELVKVKFILYGDAKLSAYSVLYSL